MSARAVPLGGTSQFVDGEIIRTENYDDHQGMQGIGDIWLIIMPDGQVAGFPNNGRSNGWSASGKQSGIDPENPDEVSPAYVSVPCALLNWNAVGLGNDYVQSLPAFFELWAAREASWVSDQGGHYTIYDVYSFAVMCSLTAADTVIHVNDGKTYFTAVGNGCSGNSGVPNGGIFKVVWSTGETTWTEDGDTTGYGSNTIILNEDICETGRLPADFPTFTAYGYASKAGYVEDSCPVASGTLEPDCSGITVTVSNTARDE